MKERVRILKADLLAQDVDAIVNAANEQLAHAGGLARAIANAAGPQLNAESRQIILERGSVPTGCAVATTAGVLPQRYVIHTPGPRWHGGERNEPALLAKSHRSVIALADELGLTSVAFPALSCGIFGYPARQAAPVAIGSTLAALAEFPRITDVRFCLMDVRHINAFNDAFAAAEDR